jgi:hypothetical protein
LASGHGATTIMDIGKDDINYGTNFLLLLLTWMFGSACAHFD